MRTVGMIFSVIVALYGAVKLYLAFLHNGDAYSLGVVFVLLGCVLFWRMGKREES